VKLPPLTGAFFLGRIVSYSIYMAGASALKDTDVGEMIRDSFTSPLGIGLQVAFLGLVVLVGRVDWSKRFGGGDSDGQGTGRTPVTAS
jgi:hypothetical protein